MEKDSKVEVSFKPRLSVREYLVRLKGVCFNTIIYSDFVMKGLIKVHLVVFSSSYMYPLR